MANYSADDDLCPVSDVMLGRLYQAPAESVAELVGPLDSETRAKLALYCYRRAHLQRSGFAIAAVCDRDMLYYIGGNVGNALFDRAHTEADTKEPTHYQQRRKVTCATWAGPLISAAFPDGVVQPA